MVRRGFRRALNWSPLRDASLSDSCTSVVVFPSRLGALFWQAKNHRGYLQWKLFLVCSGNCFLFAMEIVSCLQWKLFLVYNGNCFLFAMEIVSCLQWKLFLGFGEICFLCRKMKSNAFHFPINRKSAITIQIWLISTRFRKDFSVCK